MTETIKQQNHTLSNKLDFTDLWLLRSKKKKHTQAFSATSDGAYGHTAVYAGTAVNCEKRFLQRGTVSEP